MYGERETYRLSSSDSDECHGWRLSVMLFVTDGVSGINGILLVSDPDNFTQVYQD